MSPRLDTKQQTTTKVRESSNPFSPWIIALVGVIAVVVIFMVSGINLAAGNEAVPVATANKVSGVPQVTPVTAEITEPSLFSQKLSVGVVSPDTFEAMVRSQITLLPRGLIAARLQYNEQVSEIENRMLLFTQAFASGDTVSMQAAAQWFNETSGTNLEVAEARNVLVASLDKAARLPSLTVGSYDWVHSTYYALNLLGSAPMADRLLEDYLAVSKAALQATAVAQTTIADAAQPAETVEPAQNAPAVEPPVPTVPEVDLGLGEQSEASYPDPQTNQFMSPYFALGPEGSHAGLAYSQEVLLYSLKRIWATLNGQQNPSLGVSTPYFLRSEEWKPLLDFTPSSIFGMQVHFGFVFFGETPDTLPFKNWNEWQSLWAARTNAAALKPDLSAFTGRDDQGHLWRGFFMAWVGDEQPQWQFKPIIDVLLPAPTP